MKIERVIIQDLRSLRSRDDHLDVTGGGSTSVCLRGLNGSGKTSWLEAVAHLWQWFRRCAQARGYVRPDSRSLLAEARLVAVLLDGLPGPRPRMWVAFGAPEALDPLIDASALWPLRTVGHGVRWDPDVLAWWDEAFSRAEAGVSTVPNFVFIEAEAKFVPELRRAELQAPAAGPVYLPVARHTPSARGAGHLEGLMRTLGLARRAEWETLREALHQLRPGLELLAHFDEATLRPLFRINGGAVVTVDKLSAGERSVLINLCLVLRWLAPGGIVLLDEPELHQHVSLTRGALAVTEGLVVDRFGGQLLVASHSPEVWDHFRIDGRLLELGE